MALTDTFKPNSTCSGVIAGFGEMQEVVDRIEHFLRTSLPKILAILVPLRKNSTKVRNEKDLCAELGKRLNFAAHDELFSFYPEDPEDESVVRTLDFGAYPRIHLAVGSRLLGATDRLYAIEAKRLPTHTSSIDQPEREREYVVGHWKLRSSRSKRISGGIERFKEGLHGAALERVGMVAFVQKQDAEYWHSQVNQWIEELIGSPIVAHKAHWTSADTLKVVLGFSAGVAEFESLHQRQSLPEIGITHFWLELAGEQRDQSPDPTAK